MIKNTSLLKIILMYFFKIQCITSNSNQAHFSVLTKIFSSPVSRDFQIVAL